jgi:hypothetical protein
MKMRKILAVALIALFGVSMGAFAFADEAKGMSGDVKVGTITKVDPTGKAMIVTATPKDGSPASQDARPITIYWTETTKMDGASLREGEVVHFRATDRDGKTVATWIHVGKMEKPTDRQ